MKAKAIWNCVLLSSITVEFKERYQLKRYFHILEDRYLGSISYSDSVHSTDSSLDSNSNPES